MTRFERGLTRRFDSPRKFLRTSPQVASSEMRGEFEASLWALLRLPTKLERELDARAEERTRAVVRTQQLNSRSLGYALLAAASLIGTALLAAVNITYLLVGVGVTIFIILFMTSSDRLTR